MQVSTWPIVLSDRRLACLLTTIGIYTISKFEKWCNKNGVYFMVFAAGVLIPVSFILIIPVSSNINARAPLFLLIFYLGSFLSNRFLTASVCNERTRRDISIGIIPMLGIGLHSFIDGVIYSVTLIALLVGILIVVLIVVSKGQKRQS